jgi:hypothetical protein
MLLRQFAICNLHISIFNRAVSMALIATPLVGLLAVALLAAPDEKDDKTEDQPERQVQLAAMRKIASGLAVSIREDTPREMDMIREPLFRFNDPARDFSDGSIWGYGIKGRPAVLLSLSLHPLNGGLGWLYEINSLTGQAVEAKIPGMPNWSTRKAGLEFRELPAAPKPAEKEAGRNRQFRELSARFAGFESFRKDPAGPLERYELRLVPRPIYRYADAENGLVDGAIFLMTYGTNPEIVLVVELVREGENKAVWKYAFTRISYAELHVDLDGKEIWTQPHLQGTGSSDPYWLFFKEIPPGELERP